LHRSTPKLRGKYRLDLNALRKIPKQAFYYPNTRNLVELKQQGMVYAVCKKGYEKGRVLILTYLPWPDGSLIWVGIDYYDLQDSCKTLKKLFSKRYESVASNEVKRIYEVLGLREIGW
jgi:hypothetical protein